MWSLAFSLLLATAVGVAVFALEFVFVYRINRRAAANASHVDQPYLVPRLGQIAQACWGEMVCALKVFLWWQPFRSNAFADHLPEQPTGKRGVVLIHGFVCNRGLWMRWFPVLRSRGHAHIAVNLEPIFGSIDHGVPLIDDAVKRVTQATGMPPVLVCHSMGGLAARAWLRAGLKTQGAGRPMVRRVERVITLGTPHHGTWLAQFNVLTFVRNAQQMQQNSRWLRALQGDEADYRTGAVPSLGGSVFGRFTCFYSSCDNIVLPASTATLRGADNRHVPGVAHVAMALDVNVMDECLTLIDSP
jgi:triacylglycerol esterase/lipase EstA (alpha/beta hydrolase family)